MYKNIKNNTLFQFILKLFTITILSSILWIVAIYFYNEHKIVSNIDKMILHEKNLFLDKFDVRDLKYILNAIKKRDDVVYFEVYDNYLKQILKVKKEQNKIFDHINKILNQRDEDSSTTIHRLIPIDKENVYLFFHMRFKSNLKYYYLNMVFKLDKQSIQEIHNDIQASIIIVFTTIFMVFIFVFPTIYSQYKLLIQNKNELLQSHISTLISLGDAIAKRDSDTGDHNYRVTYYSIKIAQKLNLSNEQIRSLIKGAFLHDIGKIAINDAILLKPAKLTDDEFEIMKTHTIKGVEIVQNNPWLEDAKEVILYHHEKVDGSGYPNGLKADDIPYNARIFAVADVFDALTSKRPYKKPFSLEQSLNIIKKDTRTHFDKDVVKAFEDIYKKIYYEISDISSSKLEEIFYQSIKPYFDIKKVYIG